MIGITFGLGLIFVLILIAKQIKIFCTLLKVPGPLFPSNGLKGNLLQFMANPRQAGPSFVAKYGPLYR